MNQETSPYTVKEWPERAHITDRLGEEYERKTLSEVCEEMGIDREAALRALIEEEAKPATEKETGAEEGPAEAILAKLLVADHFLLQSEMPRISQLIATLMQTRDNLYPDLWKLEEEFRRFQAGLEGHMRREEQTLQFLQAQRWQAGLPTQFIEGTIEDILQGLEHEHALAGQALDQMRLLTQGFTPPEDADARYRALMDGLAELEKSLQQHIHLEKTVLIPRARAIV